MSEALLFLLLLLALPADAMHAVQTKRFDFSWSSNETACTSCFSPHYKLSPSFACRSDSFRVVLSSAKISEMNLTAMEVALTGAYNCDLSAQATQQAAVSVWLFDWIVASALMLPDTASCACPNCGTRVSASIKLPGPETPSPDERELVVSVLSNSVCLSAATVKLSYLVDLPDITEVIPAFVAAEGGALLTVSGFGFSANVPTFCDFVGIGARTKGIVVSPSELQCVAPKYSAGAIAPGVTVNETLLLTYAPPEEDEISVVAATLWYFVEPTITSVEPAVVDTSGESVITVHGTGIFPTNLTRCKFSNGKFFNTTDAIVCEELHIHCQVPEWPEAEVVQLSVSLNNLQYSSSIDFTFKNAFYLTIEQWFVLSGVAIVMLAAVIILTIWVSRRTTTDGYAKIRDGNVEVNFSEIRLGGMIGQGTFGEVYKGTWRGAVVAVKKLTPQVITDDFLQEFEKEVRLMQALRAPNVLQFLGSAFDPPNICIVMEYMSRGSLYGILHNPSIVLEWPLILRMMADTARGMTYLHTCKPPIIHRDLKSHNLLVDEFWKVKVCDFGLSTIMDQASQTMTACGTPCWTAPEVLKHLHYTVKADVYSFGIVLWECMSRSDPYLGMPPFKVIFSVSSEGLRPPVPDWVPPPFAQLMSRCWDDIPARRPDFSTALDLIEEITLYGWRGQPGQPAESSTTAGSMQRDELSDYTESSHDFIGASSSMLRSTSIQ